MRALALLLMFLAGQAQALSCVRPDIANTFLRADAAEDEYMVLKGRFDFDPNDFPSSSGQKEYLTVSIEAWFDGHLLTRLGFTNSISSRVVLNVSCLGHWCTGISTDTDYIAFARQTSEGFNVDLEVCGDTVFAAHPEIERKLVRCLRGQNCEPAN